MKNLTIIGGGAAALMLLSEINTDKYNVTLIERNQSIGRKFLVAGNGGLNITHNASIPDLVKQYSPSEFIAPVINQFSNQDFIKWLKQRDIATFIGSSNRVFTDFNLKPIEVLQKITKQIYSKKITFHTNTLWQGWDENGNLIFDKPKKLASDIVVFDLGGASWKITGSDGKWIKYFHDKGIQTIPFRSANCAFKVEWEKEFIDAHEGKPLKNITLRCGNTEAKGELIITKFGLEGNAIYSLSKNIQDKLLHDKVCTINIDLKPTLTVESIVQKIQSNPTKKITNILKENLHINRTAIALLKHFTSKKIFSDKEALANNIKSLPINIHYAEELDRAISTLGGISLDEIDNHLMLKKMRNYYVIGEMLDWYAPTGGYLMQGCFSMGYLLAQHLNNLEN